MALKTVTLTWDVTDLIQAGQQGTITLEPSVTLTDPSDMLVVAEVPRSVVFAAGVGQLAGIIACDNAQILPAGWGYVVTLAVDNEVVEGFPFTTFINFANGATQDLSTLTPVQSVTQMQGYLPLSGGTVTGPLTLNVPLGIKSGGTGNAINNTGDWDQVVGGPWYIYPTYATPGGAWQQAQEFAPAVKWLVANPASGPGSSVNSDYAIQIPETQAAGIQVFGYVATANAATSLSTVKGQVDSWYSFYPTLDGIYFDQVSPLLANQPYYATLYAYVKGKKTGQCVVALNPGVIPDQSYMQCSDILNIFENSYTAYQSFTPPSWQINYPACRISSIVHDVTSMGNLQTVLPQLQANRAGNIFVTDNNLYNGVPGASTSVQYWPYEVDWARYGQNLGLSATVTSVFTRTGAVVALSGDYTVGQVTGAAPLASPALTGTPTAPTQAALTNNTDIATTAYTDAAVAVETSRATTAEALKAPLSGPSFIGPVSISESAAAGAELVVTNTHSAPTAPTVELVAQAAADSTLGIEVTGDTKFRLAVDSNGKLQWSTGALASDTDLYRNSAGELKTDNSLTVGTNLAVQGANGVRATTGPVFTNGMTGATAASRYVGATTGGPPASGTFAVGDLVIDQTGLAWICTSAGTPGTWQMVTPANAVRLQQYLLPTNATAETVPREQCGGYSAALTSGTVYVSAIPLPQGFTVNNLWTMFGNTAFATVTHGWFALLDNTMTVRAVTADQTTAFQTSFATVKLATTASYTTTYSGYYYMAFCAVAGTMGVLVTNTNSITTPLATVPILAGTSSTGQTTPPAVSTVLAAVAFTSNVRFYGNTA